MRLHQRSPLSGPRPTSPHAFYAVPAEPDPIDPIDPIDLIDLTDPIDLIDPRLSPPERAPRRLVSELPV